MIPEIVLLGKKTLKKAKNRNEPARRRRGEPANFTCHCEEKLTAESFLLNHFDFLVMPLYKININKYAKPKTTSI